MQNEDHALREACEHGIRHPHPCDDCLERDIPIGRELRDHPCYGLWALAPTEFSHRAYLTKDGPIYCERCGTELDRDKKHKAGAPLSWEPRPSHAATPTPPPIDNEALVEALTRIANGWGHCSTCGAPCETYTECDCSRPTWAPDDPALVARAVLALPSIASSLQKTQITSAIGALEKVDRQVEIFCGTTGGWDWRGRADDAGRAFRALLANQKIVQSALAKLKGQQK